MPVIGEFMICQREMSNREDRYAIPVCKSEELVDHIPCMISSINNHVIKYSSRDQQGKLWPPNFHTSNNYLKTGFC